MTATYVLDASAMLALLFEEPGATVVAAKIAGARISSVSWSEVGARIADRGANVTRILAELAESSRDVVPFDRAQAEAAA